VLRPDSGDAVEAVLAGLAAAERAFGADVNTKGYRVLRQTSVIQGDGIGYRDIRRILRAVVDAGYSPESVAFGMGGGLLQRMDRDTLGLATKLCHIVYADGTAADIMKAPKTSPEKGSQPGVLAVKRIDGIPTAFPAEMVHPADDMLKVVYDGRPLEVGWESFDQLRARVEREWTALPRTADVLSPQLRKKRAQVAARIVAKN
jgi:nicotinamide phosphoribosyltransferase